MDPSEIDRTYNLRKQQIRFIESTCEKSNKNNLRIISKQDAYFQIMTKTPVKFQKNRYKIFGGVAPTRYPLSIHLVVENAMKWLSSIYKKVTKNNLRIISNPHAYFQTMNKTPVKFRENRYKTEGGVVPTRYPLSIHFVIDNIWENGLCPLAKK